jgi:hypothetical protein
MPDDEASDDDDETDSDSDRSQGREPATPMANGASFGTVAGGQWEQDEVLAVKGGMLSRALADGAAEPVFCVLTVDALLEVSPPTSVAQRSAAEPKPAPASAAIAWGVRHIMRVCGCRCRCVF